MKHVLITRAKSQAITTAMAVKKLGGNPVCLPLSKIVPLEFTLPPPSPHLGFDALLASSANAFTMLKSSAQEASLYLMPLYCVGKKTAHAARQRGFCNIVATADDAESLTPMITASPMQHFLYLAGKYRRPLLENALKAERKKVTIIEIYDQRPLTPNLKQLSTLPKPCDYVLFHASLAVRQLSPHIFSCLIDHKTKFFCLSSRIAKELPQAYAAQCVIATSPNETALLDALRQAIQQQKV